MSLGRLDRVSVGTPNLAGMTESYKRVFSVSVSRSQSETHHRAASDLLHSCGDR
jgi:hypothetical protein